MKLIYINSGDSSVMEAQVLQLLQYYHNRNIFEIVLLQGYKNKAERLCIERKLQKYLFLNIVWFKTFPNYTFFRKLAQFALFKILKVQCVGDFFIHTRGELYGAYAKLFLQTNKLPMNLLVDIRGVSIEEVELYMHVNKFLKKNKISNYLYAYSILKTQPEVNITVVSNTAKKYFVNKYGFNENFICVHPNIAGEQFVYSEEKRKEIREKLNLSDDEILVVCSTNGNAKWQKDVEIIEALVNNGCKILNLSPKVLEIDGVITKKVPYELMPSYLSAADYAVLWRDDNPVNNTASPSKFSEFACSGLHVLHNNSVGIAAEFINNYNAGIIVKEIGQLSNYEFKIIKCNDRYNVSQMALNIFGVKVIVNSYISKYESISSCK